MKRTVIVSDLSGVEIDHYASIKVTVGTDVYVLDADVTEPSVSELLAKGQKQKRRGRKAKSAA